MTKIPPSFRSVFWQTLVVIAFLSLRLLLDGNMRSFGWNEVDVLPLARQSVDPSWVSQDWYLNQETNYRFLFQTIFGWLTVYVGFLATSIIGRLVCYSMVALGLVLLGKRLGLSFPLVLLVTVVASYLGWEQGAIAGEWFVGGLEAKAVAYGLVLIAIAMMLARRYMIMILLLGLATSFHILVGGWAFLTTLGWFVVNPQRRLGEAKKSYLLLLLILYLVSSAVAIPAIFQQLFSSEAESWISPSFIYVFLRLPHHLSPFSWKIASWIEFTVYLLCWGISITLLNRQADHREWNQGDLARIELTEFTLISLIPFILGLAIASFDSQGQWLQYYPFRFGDVMLPLTSCFLTACVLESYLFQNYSKLKVLLSLVLLVIFGSQIAIFSQQAIALQDFPSQEQNTKTELKIITQWIRENTPEDAIIISHPLDLPNFTWLTERGTIAKFKLFPQTKSQIIEYYNRLNDLSRNALFKNIDSHQPIIKNKRIKELLRNGYEKLDTAQAQALMKKYHASYFFTETNQPLDLKIIYRSDPYILYGD